MRYVYLLQSEAFVCERYPRANAILGVRSDLASSTIRRR
jgi:hypothetical protein